MMGENAVLTTRKDDLTLRSGLGGKYLTFVLGEEVFGVEIIKIQEIIRMQRVTRVPRVKTFVRGVINLRGKIIPVIELRLKFSMEAQSDTEKTCIIVLQIEGMDGMCTMGIIIDEVKEVLDIPSENIEPPTMLGYSEEGDFILGIGKINNEVKILLDIDRILTTSELSTLSQVEI